MSDSNRYSGLVREAERVAAVMMNVAVEDMMGSILAEDPLEVLSIAPRARGMWAGDDSRPQGTDFFVKDTGLSGMNKKVHAKGITINMTKDMHQPSLNTAPVHPSHNVKDV